jgi:hypothetical protein
MVGMTFWVTPRALLVPQTADTTPPPSLSHRKRRRNKCISAAAIESNIILGQDITMAEALDMADKTLVGKSYGRHFSFKTLQSWVSDSWRGSPPQLNRLSKGWFMLKFANHTLAEKSLQSGWSIDSTPVLLKKWEPTFDAATERMDTIPIWVRLPGLPPQYWSTKCFQVIGNELGTFIKADMSFKETGEMVVSRILVSLNIRNGLQKQFKMTDGGRTRTHILDYEGIPFHCRHCHEHGHILRDCQQFFHGRTSNSPPAQNLSRHGHFFDRSTNSSHSPSEHPQLSGKKQEIQRADRLPQALKLSHRLPPRWKSLQQLTLPPDNFRTHLSTH